MHRRFAIILPVRLVGRAASRSQPARTGAMISGNPRVVATIEPDAIAKGETRCAG